MLKQAKFLIVACVLVFCVTISQFAFSAPRKNIHIVGSSTVYPFSTVVAERFGKKGRYKGLTVERVGTGGGFKLFCQGFGIGHPDISNASRRIKLSEFDQCLKNGIREIIEIKFGYDGIVVASYKKGLDMALSRQEIYLALAKDVPTESGGFKPNPHKRWSDIRQGLPRKPIKVMGPPPTSGTRDAFVELAMEGGCGKYDFIKKMKKSHKKIYKARCHTIREDGVYIEASENDNLIVQKLVVNPDMVGIFGFSFLQENDDKIKGLAVDKLAPNFDNIVAGTYPLFRSLYFYVKKAHIGKIPGIAEFMREFTRKRAIGENGYLVDRGLIPLSADEYKEVRATVTSLRPMTRAMLAED